MDAKVPGCDMWVCAKGKCRAVKAEQHWSWLHVHRLSSLKSFVHTHHQEQMQVFMFSCVSFETSQPFCLLT